MCRSCVQDVQDVLKSVRGEHILYTAPVHGRPGHVNKRPVSLTYTTTLPQGLSTGFLSGLYLLQVALSPLSTAPIISTTT